MKKFTPRLGIIFILMTLLVTACSAPGTAATITAAVEAPTTAAPASQPAATAVPSTDAPAATAPASPAATTSNLIQFVLVPDKSSASYKVREQLANANLPNDAVGSTSAVSGTLSIQPDGSIDASSSKFVVQLGSLQTDRSMRDNFVRRNILGTDQYPQAVFIPTAANSLPNPLPQSGDVSFKLSGNLTIRDTTKPTTWDVTGQIQGGVFTGKATTSFTFEDFNLQQPRVPIVLSVVDNITLELDFTLQQMK